MKTATLAGFLCLAAAAASLPAFGAGPAPAVKYRQAVMSAQGGHMSALAGLVNGDVDHKTHLVPHADAIGNTAKMVPSLFPAGSDKGETNALPAIWEKPAEFQKAVKALETAAPKLGAAAKSGDAAALKAAFGEVGKACKGCHDNFRMKKE
jgi:cytochrome c556